VRAATAIRAGLAIVELAACTAAREHPPLAGLWDRSVDGRVRAAATALGVRNLVSAAILASRPSRRVRLTLATVDALHAASMVALAAASPPYRRPASISATFATTNLMCTIAA